MPPVLKGYSGPYLEASAPVYFHLVIEQSRVSFQLGTGSTRFLSGKLIFFAESGRQCLNPRQQQCFSGIFEAA